MVRVLKHGDKRRTLNPVNNQWSDMITVTFIEEGRGGANVSISDTSDVLSKAVGEEIGLQTLRIHTHPVLATKIGQFPVGKELNNLFINRKLFSTPQMSQQENVQSRMIEGRPTYFSTYISEKAESDIDVRLDNNVLATINPEAFKGAKVGATEVQHYNEAVTSLLENTAIA